jgi:DNA-binding PucR family transcriptional regulator
MVAAAPDEPTRASSPAGPRLPGPAGRAVPRREGGHRHRRHLQGPPRRSPAPTTRRTAPRQTLKRLGRAGAVSAFEDLGVHRLLLQVPDLAELRSFAAEVLGKLSVHEQEHKSEYLSTLACYFRENNSPQRASRILHVHPNTVAYRIKRIEEITGLRLDNYTDRLIAQVALEILDALGEEP